MSTTFAPVEETESGRAELVYRHEVTLVKVAKRKLNDDAVATQAQLLLSLLNTRGRVAKGWQSTWNGQFETKSTEVEGAQVRSRGKKQVHEYSITFDVVCKPASPRRGIDAEFKNMVGILVAASNRHPNFNVSLVDGEIASTDTDFDEIKLAGGDEYVGYAPFELPGNARAHFGHIYDRDAQVNILLSAIEAAMNSDWQKRFHVVLEGPAACGKTEILNTIKRMCGPDSVLVFDGTSTTQAGAQKEFMEREELPRILIIEEIEKTDEAALRYLLGLLDARGEIRKQTAREKIVRDARVLCLATVNDIDKFDGMLSGALSSRFAHAVFCPRPDRALMHKILLREVNEVNGNVDWINPTLDYMEEIKSSDPRKAIAICLSGRDGWLDGSYPEMLRSIRKIGASLKGS